MPVNIGPKIGIDGEAQYRKELNNIIQQAKTLSSEMKAVTASFGKNTTAEEKNTATSRVLSQQIEVQRQRMSMLADMVKKATQEYGDADTKTMKWQQALNDATADMNRMERELEESASATDDLGDAMDDAGQKTLSFGDVLKANILGQAIVEGIKRVASAIKDNFMQAIDTASDLREVQNVVDTTFGSSANIINAFAKDAATSFGIGELQAKQFTGTLGAMFKSMGLGESQVVSMSTAMAGLAGDMASFYNLDIDTAFEKLRSGISGETEPLRQLGINMTVANLEAYALSQGITTAYSSMTQAEQATLRYNYIMQATADAQGDFAKTSDSYANQQRILALQLDNIRATIGEALLPVITNLSSALNNMLKNVDWDGFAQSIQNFIDAVIQNGPVILSIVAGIGTAFVTWNVASIISSAVTAIGGFVSAIKAGNTAMQALNTTMNANPFVLIASLIAGVVSALVTLWNTNEDFRNAVTQAWNAIKSVFENVWGAIVGFFTETIPNAWNSVVEWVQSIPEWWANIWNQVGQFFQNVWNSIISFFTETIPAWIQSIVDWFNTLPERIGYAIGQILGRFVKFGQDAWNWITTEIPKIISGIVDWFAQLPGKIWDWLVQTVQNIIQWGADMNKKAADAVSKMFTSVVNWFKELPGNIWNWLKETVTGIVRWGAEMQQKAADAVSNVISSIIDWFKSLPGRIVEIGKNIIQGLWEGIQSMVGWIKDKISGFFSGIVGGITDFLGISSPSKVFAEIGEYSGMGFEQGLSSSMGDAFKTAKKELSSGMKGIDAAVAVTGARAPSMAPSMNTMNYGGFTINVYGAQGQSEQQLAEEISIIIQNQMNRKKAVFA